VTVAELIELLGEMDQDHEVWIYTIDEFHGCGFERMSKHDVAVRDGRVEIA
jgi:hypothetical protein